MMVTFAFVFVVILGKVEEPRWETFVMVERFAVFASKEVSQDVESNPCTQHHNLARQSIPGFFGRAKSMVSSMCVIGANT